MRAVIVAPGVVAEGTYLTGDVLPSKGHQIVIGPDLLVVQEVTWPLTQYLDDNECRLLGSVELYCARVDDVGDPDDDPEVYDLEKPTTFERITAHGN